MDLEKNNTNVLNYVTEMIDRKIQEHICKYKKYPKYLKLPLWISNLMKQAMKDMEHFNLDYSTEMLLYKDLVVCETVVITKLEEIEVF